MGILFIVFLVAALYVISTICRSGHKDWKKLEGYAYAHRGLHTQDVPENSMEAFAQAIEHGYGIELDVHLLKDGNLAVFHDADLMRMTGKEGKIESLTIQELKQYTLGKTDNTIPSFSEFLQLVNGSVPIVVELKSVDGNHKELCQAVHDVLKDYSGAYCIESFDPRCVAWLRKFWPEVIRGQLLQNYFKTETPVLPWVVKLALVLQIMNLSLYPDFVAYHFPDRTNAPNFLARRLWGAKGVVWTVKTQEDFDVATKEGYISIFEGFTP